MLDYITAIVYVCIAIILVGACLLIVPFVALIGGSAFFIGLLFYLVQEFIDYQKQEIEDQ